MHVEHIHMTCIYTVREVTKSNLRLYLYTLETDCMVVLTAEWSLVYFGTIHCNCIRKTASLWFPPLFIVVE